MPQRGAVLVQLLLQHGRRKTGVGEQAFGDAARVVPGKNGCQGKVEHCVRPMRLLLLREHDCRGESQQHGGSWLLPGEAP